MLHIVFFFLLVCDYRLCVFLEFSNFLLKHNEYNSRYL